ncbi:MAG: hypothetical protein ACK532_14250 [Acidobacteriota bacterium]
MPEKIYKLQPNRTMQLRGFDAFGAAAALHSATANSFKVSGVFRDAADFAVLIVYDADNFYEHKSLKHLPDFDFDGLTLQFDVTYQGLRPLDSPRFVTIDWPYLDVVRSDNSTARIRLSDHATLLSGTHTKAGTSFTVTTNEIKRYDRVTLWYMNFAFEFVVDDAVECAYAFNSGGPGTVHRLTINGTDYTYTEIAGDTLFTVNARMAEIVNASPQLSAATGPAFQVNFRVKQDNNQILNVSSSASSNTFALRAVGKQTIAASLAAQINNVNWQSLSVALPLTATAANGILNIQSAKPGVDGNAIRMYSVSNSTRLQATTPATLAPQQFLGIFSGGSSDCTWRISLDFSALGVPSIRQMWFTYAPPIPDGVPLADTEWEATYTNWNLSGPPSKRELKVAGPDSVRVEEDSPWVKYTGIWHHQTGFYSGAFANRSADPNATVEIFYACNSTHDLYVGTTLFEDRAEVGVRLDNDTETLHNFAVSATAPIYARRLLRSSVPAGRHTVRIRMNNNKNFDFDFLEAAVKTDIPDPLPARAHASPALDYSTDHTFKLPPARIHWIFDQLGFTGPMNEYIGVFWWNQRKRVSAVIPQATVTINGSFAPGDQISLLIGGSPVGKSVFPFETNELIARHFAYFINETFVGVYAEANANTLQIINRSPTSDYSFSLSNVVQSTTGSLSISGSLENGNAGTWEIDAGQNPPLNRAARDWHLDFSASAAARSRELVIACSMELVQPPAGFAAVFPDGQEVVTSVGFANLNSTHCTFNTAMREYQKRVYRQIADIQAAAGLTPNLQFGEFLWWFFTNHHPTSNPGGGMAFYDPETAAHAQTALGRPLHRFLGPNDDPNINGGADATLLRNLLRDYIAALRAHVLAAHPGARFELLYPYDVNHPSPAGIFNLGGALNYFVNFPVEFRSKATSGLDRIKMEALDFGAWTRSLDLSRTAILFPIELGWPKDSVRYLVPVFRGGAAWEKEYLEAKGVGVPVINFWAHDHFNLFNLSVTEPTAYAGVQNSG